jgi:hypothetical protein
MKNLLFFICLLLSISLHSQEIKKADALVSPRITERSLTVGGESADLSGFDNRSIQFAIDAIAKTGGTGPAEIER